MKLGPGQVAHDFALEDKADEMVPLIRDFLGRNLTSARRSQEPADKT